MADELKPGSLWHECGEEQECKGTEDSTSKGLRGRALASSLNNEGEGNKRANNWEKWRG